MICGGWPSCPYHLTPTMHYIDTVSTSGTGPTVGYAEYRGACSSCGKFHPKGLYHGEFNHTSRCNSGGCHE